jgi:hypothetical protein
MRRTLVIEFQGPNDTLSPAIFSKIGKQTPMFARFSTVAEGPSAIQHRRVAWRSRENSGSPAWNFWSKKTSSACTGLSNENPAPIPTRLCPDPAIACGERANSFDIEIMRLAARSKEQLIKQHRCSERLRGNKNVELGRRFANGLGKTWSQNRSFG